MPHKKINQEQIEELDGPMNDVATEDSRVYANVDESRPLDIHKERQVRAKKQQIKNSSKKANRRLNKTIMKYSDSIDDNTNKK
jgi:hypothetical protein